MRTQRSQEIYEFIIDLIDSAKDREEHIIIDPFGYFNLTVDVEDRMNILNRLEASHGCLWEIVDSNNEQELPYLKLEWNPPLRQFYKSVVKYPTYAQMRKIARDVANYD